MLPKNYVHSPYADIIVRIIFEFWYHSRKSTPVTKGTPVNVVLAIQDTVIMDFVRATNQNYVEIYVDYLGGSSVKTKFTFFKESRKLSIMYNEDPSYSSWVMGGVSAAKLAKTIMGQALFDCIGKPNISQEHLTLFIDAN